jgi:hypothetical protein
MGSIRPGWAAQVISFVALATLAIPRIGADADEPALVATKREALAISKPVICKEVRGYEDYDVRADDSLRKDEKMLIYYIPLGYEEHLVGDQHRVHLTQEGRVRKRGQKAVVFSKKEMLIYDVKYAPPSRPIYLQNIVSLKELKAGEYTYDIVLTDKLGGGTVTRSVPFKVVAAAAEKADPAAAPQPDAKPKAKAKKALTRKTRRNGEVERLIESILNESLIDSMID